ncbi:MULTISPECIES: hypothetical protein [unclassified Lysobacter]|uniref:hypothetical protein n=1 Tax=unclassified Lysobacter TaxID=2635362 RepID=UPI0012F76C23|nr:MULTISPECIES: hypothetical protein [unclassified Lysobacter]
MIIFIISSLVFLLGLWVAFSGKGGATRAIYAVGIASWSAFLLYFYMDAAVRVVAQAPRAEMYSTSDFISGIVAYRNGLDWFRFSLSAVIAAAALVAGIPPRDKQG